MVCVGWVQLWIFEGVEDNLNEWRCKCIFESKKKTYSTQEELIEAYEAIECI